MNIHRKKRLGALTALLIGVLTALAQAQEAAPTGNPAAVLDLATEAGVKLVNGQWRYSDTRIIEVDFKAPGADQQPTGKAIKTYDYEPKAGGADFDDSRWEAVAATSLTERRATGRLCFNWYRLKLTVPERVGEFATKGATIVFQTALDDYAEVWVDGELSRRLGQMGGSVVAGWNAPNRLVIGRDVQPGQQIQLAVFGINGPISNPPTNFIWVREARLEFYRTETPGPFAVSSNWPKASNLPKAPSGRLKANFCFSAIRTATSSGNTRRTEMTSASWNSIARKADTAALTSPHTVSPARTV